MFFRQSFLGSKHSASSPMRTRDSLLLPGTGLCIVWLPGAIHPSTTPLLFRSGSCGPCCGSAPKQVSCVILEQPFTLAVSFRSLICNTCTMLTNELDSAKNMSPGGLAEHLSGTATALPGGRAHRAQCSATESRNGHSSYF